MVQPTPTTLADLYDLDETAWLEQSAALVRAGRLADLDVANLAEYLTDMAERDRREVKSRLAGLLMHLLKWDYQPDKRTGSWLATILTQQRDMRDILDSGTLRRHAEEVLAAAYAGAVKAAAAETGLDRTTFPAVCP